MLLFLLNDEFKRDLAVSLKIINSFVCQQKWLQATTSLNNE